MGMGFGCCRWEGNREALKSGSTSTPVCVPALLTANLAAQPNSASRSSLFVGAVATRRWVGGQFVGAGLAPPGRFVLAPSLSLRPR
jgi:hypothetical protein